jgi:hypothetical protein
MRSDRFRRWQLAVAGAAGVLTAGLLRALPGLAGLGLVAYGAWLAWPPAGFLAAGALILADVVTARYPGRRPKGGEQ